MIPGQQTQFGWFFDGSLWEMFYSYAFIGKGCVYCGGKAFSIILLGLAVGDSVEFVPFNLLDVAILD